MYLRPAPPLSIALIAVVTAETGSMICPANGFATLVPRAVRWLAPGTDSRVDQIFLRPGAHLKPASAILPLRYPDLNPQIKDAEMSIKKSEAELGNLRVQLLAQLLNEKDIEAQLAAEPTKLKLRADREEALFKMQVGASMKLKISRGSDSRVARLRIENENLPIADEAPQAPLTAKQAEVAQVQVPYELRNQQKDSLLVRAGIDGVLEEIAIGAGQQINTGSILASVRNFSRRWRAFLFPRRSSVTLI